MNCNTISLGGLQYLFFAPITVNASGNTFNYYYSSTGVVSISELDTYTLPVFEKIHFNEANFKQKKVTDTKCSYYQKTFDITTGDFMNETLQGYIGQNLLIVFQ